MCRIGSGYKESREINLKIFIFSDFWGEFSGTRTQLCHAPIIPDLPRPTARAVRDLPQIFTHFLTKLSLMLTRHITNPWSVPLFS
ncbi:hypothetical protein Y032_0058g2932 [Ancylostoma ceylanicum]|uniref:Uncharacterized protein n=1 Tax=Ancylostoma ceylanicum TaxID=53326 RepID=A0A016U5Y8_9BILA|nr:hypothetical protein Y032_0058g2932 [Ancylostoma ceylanicum]